MRVFLICGIGKHQGEHSVDLLGARLEALGFEVVDGWYEPLRWFNVRSRHLQFEAAYSLLPQCRDGDNVVAHSAGCLLAHRLTQIDRQFRRMIFFAPAMNRDVTFSEGMYEQIHVIHNPMDKAIRVAKLLHRHDFGALGSEGYNGHSKDVHSHPGHYDKPGFWSTDHGPYFKERNLSLWTQKTAEYLTV